MPATVYCQDTSQINKTDSLGNRRVLEISYDVENIKYFEVLYVDNEPIRANFVSRKGDTISAAHNWEMDITLIRQIQGRLARKFIYTDATAVHGNGGALFYLILDYKKNILELRSIRRVTEDFDKEIIRIAHEVEKDLIHILPPDLKTPIVIPFPFRPHIWQQYLEYLEY